MEETVGKDEKKRRKSQKVVENPTNKMKPVSFGIVWYPSVVLSIVLCVVTM